MASGKWRGPLRQRSGAGWFPIVIRSRHPIGFPVDDDGRRLRWTRGESESTKLATKAGRPPPSSPRSSADAGRERVQQRERERAETVPDSGAASAGLGLGLSVATITIKHSQLSSRLTDESTNSLSDLTASYPNSPALYIDESNTFIDDSHMPIRCDFGEICSPVVACAQLSVGPRSRRDRATCRGVRGR